MSSLKIAGRMARSVDTDEMPHTAEDKLMTITKHTYSNIFKISPPKTDIFHIYAQNIGCGYSLELPQWDSSNEYPQSMFLSRNKKIYPPCTPQFYYI